jgi:hypothetical protein
MELWQYYKQAWEAERALKAAVPTAWLVKGGVAFAVVRFPREAEPGEWWAERAWVAVPWVFPNGLFGAVAHPFSHCTAPSCSLKPTTGSVFSKMCTSSTPASLPPCWGQATAVNLASSNTTSTLRDEAVKQKAVEKARRVKYCRF